MNVRLVGDLIMLAGCAGMCGMQPYLCTRWLSCEDYNRGYLSLLEQLTTVGADQITHDQFDDFVRTLSPNHVIVVIEDTTRKCIVAAATLFIERKCIHGMGSVGHIEDVVVDSRLRGKGLGREVVNFLTDYACTCGCYKVILDCASENVPFYEKCGFVCKGVEMAQYF